MTLIMGKRILLADDSLTIQKVVELTLAGTDYELTCVSNGHEALESLRQSRPDLILADVVMPEKNGYEVCEAVKSNPATARIPVLLLSGTFEPFDRDRADRVAADRVVSKPFDAQQLLDQIETLLAREAGGHAADSTAPREGAPGNAFLDDTIPTLRTAGMSEAVQLDAAETEVSSHAAQAEFVAAEDFSGGPVFLPTGEARAATDEARTRHPVEEAPAFELREEMAGPDGRPADDEILFDVPAAAPVPPAGPAGEGAGLEEISAEEAVAFFDMPAAAAPDPPASPIPALTDLTDEQIERIADLVVAKLSDRVLREIVWEVVPDVAETVVKRRIQELESGAE
jgi:CheY-like chemotaxis protein